MVQGIFIAGVSLARDLSTNFLLYDKITFAASYRLDAVVRLLVEYQTSEDLFIGYAHDYGTQKSVNYNSGSPEIFVSLEITKGNNDKFLTPRFF